MSSNTIQFTTTHRINVFCSTALFINAPPSGPECFWVPPHWCLDCKWYTDISPFSFTFFFHILVFAPFPRNAFVNCIKFDNNKTLIHHIALLTNIKEHLKFNMCKKLCCLFQSAPSIARMCDKKCQRQNTPRQNKPFAWNYFWLKTWRKTWKEKVNQAKGQCLDFQNHLHRPRYAFSVAKYLMKVFGAWIIAFENKNNVSRYLKCSSVLSVLATWRDGVIIDLNWFLINELFCLNNALVFD